MSQHSSQLPWYTLAILFFITAVGAATLPACQLGAARQQTTLNSVRTAFVNVTKYPFGIAYASQKNVGFVALAAGLNKSTLGILDTSTFPPSLSHQISLPDPYINISAVAGIALYKERHVLVTSGPGLIVVDALRAVANKSDAVVGMLNGTTETQTPGVGAIEVTVSLDDKFAFVSQEYGAGDQNGISVGNVDVFKLHRPSLNGTVHGTAVRYLNLSHEVVGTALSPDGLTMYATSEAVAVGEASGGTISVIDVATLEITPSQALLTNTSAGCGAVRVLVSSDGKMVWVTARESNHLLAFDAAKLKSHPEKALLASVQVGTSPVGLTFVRNETRILTADSNRMNYANATSGLSVIDVKAALAGKPAVLGRIPAGLFPREFAVSPDGTTVLVSNYMSGQVQAVDVTTLP